MVKEYVPERGDVVWIDFDSQQGKEINKRRPALILSPKDYNAKAGLALVVPITSRQKGYPFEVVFESPFISGVILSDQLKSFDWRQRKTAFAGKASSQVLRDVTEKIHVLLLG